MTEILPFDDASIARAATLIRSGDVVAIASETVYGLAADATNGEAVARIYAAKQRPSFNPLIVHVLSLRQASDLARFDGAAEALGKAFWPGPLTLVLPLRKAAPIASLVSAGLDTVALRVPAHPALRALLVAAGRPLAAPSANASGTISPTTAAHVARSLTGRIPLIVDAGPTAHGLESTIVKVELDRLLLLRPGPIDTTALEDVARLPVVAHSGGAIIAPGQLASHYAPRQPVRLNARAKRADEWLIGFGAVSGDATLSASGDLQEAAARLFAALHEAEGSGKAVIAVAPIPEDGLGWAINDRLRRAAAPRET
jgi:L-threonylcarbamoyladenylate synthase